MTGPVRFSNGVRHHVGQVREINEDSVLARPEIGLWAVADGMGGHGGGDVASRAVVDGVGDARAERLRPRDLLGEFEQQDRARQRRPARACAVARDAAVIGTTLVALMVHRSHFRLRLVRRQPRLLAPRRRAFANLARSFRGPGAHRPRPARPGGGQDLAAPQRRDPGARRDGSGRARSGRRTDLCRGSVPAVQRRTDHPCRDEEIAALMLGSGIRRKPATTCLHLTLDRGAQRQCLDHRRRLRGRTATEDT